MLDGYPFEDCEGTLSGNRTTSDVVVDRIGDVLDRFRLLGSGSLDRIGRNLSGSDGGIESGHLRGSNRKLSRHDAIAKIFGRNPTIGLTPIMSDRLDHVEPAGLDFARQIRHVEVQTLADEADVFVQRK